MTFSRRKTGRVVFGASLLIRLTRLESEEIFLLGECRLRIIVGVAGILVAPT